MKRNKDYEILLFDADGTLFDYDKAEAFALERTCEVYGLAWEEPLAALYRGINSALWKQFEQGGIDAASLKVERFRQLLEALNAEGDPAEMSGVYLDNLKEGDFLIEGAVELISSLRDRYTLVLLTNGLEAVQRRRLAKSPLGDSFKAVIISDAVGLKKPDPRIFELAVGSVTESPNKEGVLMIGDSLTSDIQGGVNYGVDTCWYNPFRQSRPETPEITYEVHSLGDLGSLLA